MDVTSSLHHEAVALEPVSCAICGSSAQRPVPLRTPRDQAIWSIPESTGRSRWVACEGCGLVFQSPRPNQVAIDAFYGAGGYHAARGGVPEHYIRYSLRRSRAALDWVLGLIGEPSDGRRPRALDIGCGVGGALVALRGRGWDVRGVEPDPELSEVARRRFDLDVVTAMFDESVVVEPDIDLVYSCHVWEHLADPVDTTAAARRLAGPGGHIAIVVPTFRRARTWAWTNFSTPHTYQFTDVSLGNVLDAAGFDVVGWRFVAGGDSELWMVARARPDAEPCRGVRTERAEEVCREIARVPLRTPLGLPGRAISHARTLTEDPVDFVGRAGRLVAGRARRVTAAFRGGA